VTFGSEGAPCTTWQQLHFHHRTLLRALDASQCQPGRGKDETPLSELMELKLEASPGDRPSSAEKKLGSWEIFVLGFSVTERLHSKS
jgi:hypothetical protein